MTLGVVFGRTIALACALVAFTHASDVRAQTATRAAELGPEAVMAEPSGGFVGQLHVAPQHGPAGTPLTVTGEGFPPNETFDLVWRTVKGRWKVTIAEYHGREFIAAGYRIATIRSDAAGLISARFVAPEDFGFLH